MTPHGLLALPLASCSLDGRIAVPADGFRASRMPRLAELFSQARMRRGSHENLHIRLSGVIPQWRLTLGTGRSPSSRHLPSALSDSEPN
jgi:hypothetical protein